MTEAPSKCESLFHCLLTLSDNLYVYDTEFVTECMKIFDCHIIVCGCHPPHPPHRLVFWTSDTGIKTRDVNSLFTLECVNVTLPRALAIDSSRQQLYYLTVDTNGVVTLGQVEYSVGGCCCKTEHVLSMFTLQHSLTVSMVYAAGTLFFAQYSPTIIYFVSADLAAINPNTTMLAVGEVRPSIDVFFPSQFRDLSVILEDTQPLPG